MSGTDSPVVQGCFDLVSVCSLRGSDALIRTYKNKAGTASRQQGWRRKIKQRPDAGEDQAGQILGLHSSSLISRLNQHLEVFRFFLAEAKHIGSVRQVADGITLYKSTNIEE